MLVGAAVLRVWLLTTTAARLDGDEAITGTMARRIADGHHLAFYAGQAYMGSAEQYLQAGVLAVLPDSSFTLRLVQVALAVVACSLVHAVARRCGLSTARSLVAAALFAAGPYFAVLESVKSHGAYLASLVLALAGLLVALRTEPGRHGGIPSVALFGVICGLAAWENVQAAYILVPAALWLAGTVRQRLVAGALAGAAGFAVGFSPALGHLLLTGPLDLSGQHPPRSFAERADHFVSEALPRFVGTMVKAEPLAAWLPPALVTLVVVGVAGAAVVNRSAGIGRILRLRAEERSGIDLLVLVVAVSPLFFIQSGSIVDNPRYLFVLYGVVPVLVAAVPSPRRWLPEREDRWIAAGVVVFALALHTFVGAQQDIADDDGGEQTRAGQRVRSEELGPVVDALVAAGARTAYADYWLAQVLQWEAGDRLVVEPLYTKRFPHASTAAGADPSPALVVAANEAEGVAEALTRRGSTFEVSEAAGWWLFTSIEPGQHPGYTFAIVEDLTPRDG